MEYRQPEYDDRCDHCKKGTHYGVVQCEAKCSLDLCEECQFRCEDCSFTFCPDHIVIIEHENGTETHRCQVCAAVAFLGGEIAA